MSHEDIFFMQFIKLGKEISFAGVWITGRHNLFLLFNTTNFFMNVILPGTYITPIYFFLVHLARRQRNTKSKADLYLRLV